jgi:hypothetical protein
MNLRAQRKRWSRETVRAGTAPTGRLWRKLLLGTIVITFAGATAAGAAVLHHHPHHKSRANTFSCQGIGVAIPLLGKKDNVAVGNKRPTPCRTKKAFIEHVTSSTTLPIHVNAAVGRTWRQGRARRAGKRAVSLGRVGHAVVGSGNTGIDVGAVSAKIIERCVSKGGKLVPESSVKSSVGTLNIAGSSHKGGNAPKKIVIPKLATIWLNRTIRQGHTLVRRGLEIDLGGNPAVILGQAMVSFRGHPCG